MTIQTTIPLDDYIENGVTLSHAVPFQFETATDLRCSRISNGVETVLTLGTDYTVSGGAGAIGAVTKTSPGTVGTIFRIKRETSRAQQMDYTPGDAFPAESHEAQLDRLSAVDQEQDVDIADLQSRSLRVPVGEVAPLLPTKGARAGKFLAGDANGDIVPASGTGGDAALRADLANVLGAALVGIAGGGSVQDALNVLLNFTQTGTGAKTYPATVKRQQHLDVRDYLTNGAVAVGSDVTTDVQKAVNEAGVRNAKLHYAPGVKHGQILVTQPCEIEGDGARATVTAAPGNYDMFVVSSNDVTIRKLIIQAAAKTGGRTFKQDCGTATLNRVTFDDVVTYDDFGLYYDAGSGPLGYHIDTKLKELRSIRTRGPGVVTNRLFAYGKWIDVAVEYQNVAASDFKAFAGDMAGLMADTGSGAVGGLWTSNLNASGTAGVYDNPNQVGFDFANFNDLRLDARADSMAGDGFRYGTINKLTGPAALSQLCNGHQHVFTGVINSVLLLIYAIGRKGLPGAAAAKDGVRFVSGCSVLGLANILSRDNTGDDVSKLAAQIGPILIGAGLQGDQATGLGVKSVGDSPFVVADGILSGNSANYNLGGATDYLRSMMLNSGAMIDVGPGPVSA